MYLVRQRGWFPPGTRMRDSHESGGHHAAGAAEPGRVAPPASLDRFPFGRV